MSVVDKALVPPFVFGMHKDTVPYHSVILLEHVLCELMLAMHYHQTFQNTCPSLKGVLKRREIQFKLSKSRHQERHQFGNRY